MQYRAPFSLEEKAIDENSIKLHNAVFALPFGTKCMEETLSRQFLKRRKIKFSVKCTTRIKKV